MKKIIILIFLIFTLIIPAYTKNIVIDNRSNNECSLYIKTSNLDYKIYKIHSKSYRKISYPKYEIKEITLKCRNLTYSSNNTLNHILIKENKSGVIYLARID
ncbi:hypothetical protein GF385_01405 [Candidatus Dependentiae bacterium]|nr:hypothetical protein [Candidatus Dependentiae bacterium]